MGTLSPKMPVDRELMREIRDLDEFDLRRLLIFVRGLLTAREGGGGEVFMSMAATVDDGLIVCYSAPPLTEETV